MAALASLPLLFMLILILITKVITQPPNFLGNFCIDENGNYTVNSTYQTNLNNLLSALPTNNGNGYGFYSLSIGNAPDTANAIGLCRGDVGPDDCRSCLHNMTQLLPSLCPNRKEAIGWYDSCMLRYSNRNIYGSLETQPDVPMTSRDNLSANVEDFYYNLKALFDDLKNRTASAGSLRKFRTGNTNAPDFTTIYALVQCTPDLSPKECIFCLDTYFGILRECCNAKVGGRVIGPNCNFRYEVQPFFQHTEDAPFDLSPPQANSTTAQRNGSHTSTTIIIVVVSSAAAFVVLLASACVYLRMKKKKIETRPLIYEPVKEIESADSLQFSFEIIKAATDNFSEANKLGQGGFGPVYKGRISDGQLKAVKRLSTESGQGDLEFKNEVMLVAKLQHRNLVKLLGFCLEGSERLLVYEFVPNASLDHFLFDPRKRPSLDWERRYKIIRGTARGLLYLHEVSRLRIIHRDLKASNILLDEEMNPKISDFGMARLFHVDQTQGSTSRIVGTYGYMAPEYVMHGHFSVKSDVYSFGVLLLEIVIGRKSNCFHQGEQDVEDLLSYAWRSWRDQTASNIVDPLLRQGLGSDIIRFIHIALLCVQENIAHRPTMDTVILMLNSNSLSLPIPSQPGFFMRSTTELDAALPLNFNSSVTNESDHSTSGPAQDYSANEASISEFHPR